MPDIIHLLSDDIANKIAAGEVVVRPAAVVKELLENAVDAGSTDIQLIIKDGGKVLIQVVDNGSGMSPTDARMSFERHATSKIRQIDDLFSISTMGFRGEALPSIAAVAKVELKTKTANDSLGSKIKIEGADFVLQEACQTKKGTSIAVKSLFYNVPARRKFLKSSSVETRHILEEFTRIALANPNIKMVCYNNDKEVFHLPVQSLHKRIAALFGKKVEERIVPVEEDTDIVKISGFIGKPEFAKKSKGQQYFFVNNRFIRSAYLNHAVIKAFLDFIDPKQYPLYVLFLEIDPNNIDINVHPSKHEVKFENEKHVYTIVSAAVRHALSKFMVTPSIDFDIDPSFNRHEFFQQPSLKNDEIDNFSSKKEGTFLQRASGSSNAQNQDWQKLYSFDDDQQKQIEQIATDRKENKATTYGDMSFSQLNLRYIAVQHQSGFLLVDQRRAHQRILYEQLLKSFELHGFPSQKLLFPETISLPPVLLASFDEHKEKINHLGFDLQIFGADNIIVHATPAELQIDDIAQFLESLLTELSGGIATNQSAPEKAISKHLALYGAIRYGQKLTVEEMTGLFNQLMACEQPNYGIRRDKTFLDLGFEELNRSFSL